MATLRQSSRVISGSAPPVVAGDDEEMGGEVAGGEALEVPTYASAADDPAVCIGSFKEARAAREATALARVVNGAMLLCFVGIFGANWLNHNYFNPLREEVTLEDGTTIHRLTEMGGNVYFFFFLLNNVSLGGVLCVPVDYDEILSQVVWKDIFAGKRPPWRSIALYALIVFIFCSTLDNIGTKYGWLSSSGGILAFVQFIFVGRCQFAPHVGEGEGRHPLLRRLTALEWIVLYYLTFTALQYPPFDLYCIHTGQWDGKVVGKAGGLAMVVMELLSCVFVYWYWGRWAYTTRLPPRYTAVQSSLVDKKEKGRIDLFAEMWLAAQFQFGVHQFCHWLALLPEADDGSRTLITVTDSVAGGWATLMFCFLIPNAIIYGFRKQFFQLLTAGARDKQRLQDGAFIAALLVDEKGDMIEEARKIFRGVPFSKLSAGLLQSSTGTEEDYALSQPCELGSIDYFISHSWSDDGEEKFARLSVVAADFQREHGREPIFWLDKVCIDQTSIARALRCLPVFVFSCDRLLVLAGTTYCTRLWCVWELYVFFCMSGERALDKCTMLTFGEADQTTLTRFDVAGAHCFDPADEEKLRSIIESEGASSFNDAIREVGEQLQMVGSGAKR